ncbi:hypothetical protein DFH08DRAFT_944722 [Mycena albidolilacea]|uniref:Uncharacterized protein n=1 Tax=Mycena albidolilacea TaxID=1033008 RepID=A0AAD6Z418_9AGAR|nr:hypothetical protein DFH08DRAFT_944722 [Mycena albidolilacea]
MPEFMRVSLSGQVRETKGFCVRPPSPRTWIHGDWYTDPSLPEPWSTDWEDWEGLRLFEQTVDGKLKIEKLFKDVFDVPGTVEPLAYVVATGSELYLFKAGGRYNLWSDGRLTVPRMEFASSKDFLDHTLQEDATICRT